MHFGRQNTRPDYTFNGVTLDIGKGLGVLVSEHLKVASHVAAAAEKTNSKVGIMRRDRTWSLNVNRSQEEEEERSYRGTSVEEALNSVTFCFYSRVLHHSEGKGDCRNHH